MPRLFALDRNFPQPIVGILSDFQTQQIHQSLDLGLTVSLASRLAHLRPHLAIPRSCGGRHPEIQASRRDRFCNPDRCGRN